MKSKEFIQNWLDKKYAGGKENGDWTSEEVSLLLDDFQNEIWEKAKEYIVETEETEDSYSQQIIGTEDLKYLLNIPELLKEELK